MAEAVPTPSGRTDHWAALALHKILTNPIYAGHAAAYRHITERVTGGKMRVRDRPLDEQIALPEGLAPPIVTALEQQAVLARLATN
jgi:hypothetical protein